MRCRSRSVAALFKAADKSFGRPDIAFANAGIADLAPQPLHDYPTENWNAVIAVNLQGVFYTDREVLRIMVRQQSGKLINVASMWGSAGASSVADPRATTEHPGQCVLPRVFSDEIGRRQGSALYLPCGASSFTTGSMLVTDGGCMAN